MTALHFFVSSGSDPDLLRFCIPTMAGKQIRRDYPHSILEVGGWTEGYLRVQSRFGRSFSTVVVYYYVATADIDWYARAPLNGWLSIAFGCTISTAVRRRASTCPPVGLLQIQWPLSRSNWGWNSLLDATGITLGIRCLSNATIPVECSASPSLEVVTCADTDLMIGCRN